MKTLTLLLVTLVVGAYALNLDNVELKRPENRIVNGTEASTTDMPYQVVLFNFDSSGYHSYCGGSLITELHVLTAARCYPNLREGIAFVGSNKYGVGQSHPFKHVTIHENWNENTGKNDIAIVRLDTPVFPNGKTVNIITMANWPLEPNINVIVSGFGFISDSISTDKLHYAQLTTISNRDCSNYLQVDDSMVCTIGNAGKAFCRNDLGGPLVINWPNNPILVGIVSRYSRSCQNGSPQVFTRVDYYRDWISRQIYR